MGLQALPSRVAGARTFMKAVRRLPAAVGRVADRAEVPRTERVLW